jgi:hypothetical protein
MVLVRQPPIAHQMAAAVLCPPHTGQRRWPGLRPAPGRAGISSKARCDLPPFHVLAARRTLAGWIRHSPAVNGNAASRANGIARQTPHMTISHPGMTAVRLGVTLRTVIIELHLPARPPRSQDLSFLRHRHSGREAARGACHTPLGPPLACATREAAEAAAGSRSNPRMDCRRSRGR